MEIFLKNSGKSAYQICFLSTKHNCVMMKQFLIFFAVINKFRYSLLNGTPQLVETPFLVQDFLTRSMCLYLEQVFGGVFKLLRIFMKPLKVRIEEKISKQTFSCIFEDLLELLWLLKY